MKEQNEHKSAKDEAHLSPHELSARLGERLVQLRMKSGLSQEKVAHQADISTYTYQKMERGISSPENPANPKLYTLMALAEVYEIPVWELLDFSEEEAALNT